MNYRSPLACWLFRQTLTFTEWRAFKAHLKGEWLMPEILDDTDLDHHLRAWRRGQRNQEKNGC